MADDLPIGFRWGRATLDQGERLGSMAADGPILLHTEAGTVGLAETGPGRWVRTTASEQESMGGEAALAAGDRARIVAGAVAEVRAAPAAAATLLVVTLLPADEAAQENAEPAATVAVEG